MLTGPASCFYMFVFGAHRMLLEKCSATRLSFSVAVSEDSVTLQYGQSSSPKTYSVSFRTEGRLPLETWTHLTLQVRNLKSWIKKTLLINTIYVF